MKKGIASILICLVFLGFPQKSHAVALPAAALASATALAVVGSVYFHLNPNSNFTASASGIQQASHASYFTLLAATQTVSAVTDAVTTSMSWDAFKAKISASPADYPKLNSSLYDSVAVPSSTGVNGSTPNDTYVKMTDNTYRKLSGKSLLKSNSSWSLGCYPYFGSMSYDYGTSLRVCNSSATGDYTYYDFVSTTVPASSVPAGSPKTNEQLPSSVGALSSDVAANDEARRLIQSGAAGGYVEYKTPDLSTLYPTPSNVISPAQAAAIESKQTAASAAAAAAAAANSHAASTAAAAAADPSNADLANQASGAAAAAAAAASGLAASQAAEAEKTADIPANFDPPPELIKFNWGSAHKLLGAMQTAWPFNLLLSLRGLFAPLESSPVAPSFDYVVWGHTYNVSLSRFDGIASITRWVFSVLLISGAIMAVVRWYRGSN